MSSSTMLMVDWVSCLIPFPHSEAINSGNVISLDQDGKIEWKLEKRITVEGSYSTKIQIRSEHRETRCSHIYFSGNPVKFLQGHNVFGSCDIYGLLLETMKRVLRLVQPDADLSTLSDNILLATLSRVDLTSMYDLGSEKQVKSWLFAAEQSARMSHRGRGQFSGSTLYWGKKSRRWALKMYHKGSELKAHKKTNVFSPTDLDLVTNYADKSLRVEVVIRGKELKEKGFEGVWSWGDNTAEKLYNGYLSRLEFSENMRTIDTNLFDKLPARLIAVVSLWKEGHDLKSMYPKRTYYRYRKDILEAINVDISIRSPNELPEPSNVIPLIQVLEAKPMDVPSFAVGTSLYFEPDYHDGNLKYKRSLKLCS